MESLSSILSEHPFFAGLPRDALEVLTGCTRNERYEPAAWLFRSGEPANAFFLVRHGRVAVQMAVRGGPVVVKTIEPGEVLGWAWLVPPHTWRFAARAVELTRVLRLDGACLRQRCESDKALGFELLRRLAHDLEDRLYDAWIQMEDVYGPPGR